MDCFDCCEWIGHVFGRGCGGATTGTLLLFLRTRGEEILVCPAYSATTVKSELSSFLDGFYGKEKWIKKWQYSAGSSEDGDSDGE